MLSRVTTALAVVPPHSNRVVTRTPDINFGFAYTSASSISQQIHVNSNTNIHPPNTHNTPIHTHVNTHIHIFTPVQYISPVYIYIYIYTPLYIHIQSHKPICTQTHTTPHTYTHRNTLHICTHQHATYSNGQTHTHTNTHKYIHRNTSYICTY